MEGRLSVPRFEMGAGWSYFWASSASHLPHQTQTTRIKRKGLKERAAWPLAVAKHIAQTALSLFFFFFLFFGFVLQRKAEDREPAQKPAH